MNPAFGLLLGIAFGAVLATSGLSDPRRIVAMLRLRDLFVLKLLVTALAVGIVGAALLDEAGLAHLKVKPIHVAANLLGGVLFGAGFAIAGYCPGTALAACAEGRRDAPLTVVGGLIGTALFAWSYGTLRPLLVEPWSHGPLTLPEVVGLSRTVVVAARAAAASIVIAWWLHREGPPPKRDRSTPRSFSALRSPQGSGSPLP